MGIGIYNIDGVERKIVSPFEWQQAREAMTTKEKAHMRAGDRLAADRRAMPWMAMDAGFEFEGPEGTTDLAGLFKGRSQLITYHFMFGPTVPGWPTAGCEGCSMFADQVGHLDHVRARDIEFVLVSPSPRHFLEAYRARMGWDIPWYTGTAAFNRACDVADDLGNSHGLNVFYRSGGTVYRTHFVCRRGVETLGTVWTLLDIVPLGRQETWEDLPPGSPSGKPYEWWRRHDEYASEPPHGCPSCRCTPPDHA